MAHKYSIEEKVENYFSTLRPRYKPFQMHQFCANCGRDFHRTQFKMLGKFDKQPVTDSICKWCRAEQRRVGKLPPQNLPPQWEDRERMKARLLKEFGTASFKLFGQYHTAAYKLSKKHRDAIRQGVLRAKEQKEKK